LWKPVTRLFYLGSEPLWDWGCSVLDSQDSIKELMDCVLRPKKSIRLRGRRVKTDEIDKIEMSDPKHCTL
jgi:hypothetical protein